MRNRVLGAIGLVWGGAIVVQLIRAELISGSGAYQTGQLVAGIFGLVMGVTGAYYLFRKQKG